MRKSLTILLMVVRLFGVIQLALGLGLWFGAASGLVTIHTAIGSLFVLALWVIAVLVLRWPSLRPLAVAGLVIGSLIMWLGMAQTRLLVGDMHWVIRVAHLLLGLAGMGLGESLVKRAKLQQR